MPKKSKDLEPEVKWLSVIGKSLAFVAMKDAEVPKKIGVQAKFLASMGLDKDDIAGLLKSSPESIRVLLIQARGSSRGKRKKKGD